jgi:hypothetical protein
MTTIERADEARSRMLFLLANHERALETLAWFMSGNQRSSSVVTTASFLAVRHS